jgi:hypothetical protein
MPGEEGHCRVWLVSLTGTALARKLKYPKGLKRSYTFRI